MQAGAAHPALPGLDSVWAAQRSWTVLDTGFGTGIPFLALWQHWRAHAQRPALLHYVGLLGADHALALAAALGRADTPFAPLAAQLAAHCYGLEPGFHRILLDGGQLSLTLCVGERPALLAQQELRADTLLAHAEGAGWDKWQLKALARCCRRGTQLVFGGAHLPDAHLLADAGFVLDAGAALPAVQAVYNPRWELRSSRRSTHETVTPGRCAVIGAGIAGASVARALAQRGWQVDVYDAAAHCAGGASGLPVGLVVPHHSADDSPRSRMSRSGTRLMLQHANALLRAQQDWNPGGVLELSVEETGLAEEEAELLSRPLAKPVEPAGAAGATGVAGTATATAGAVSATINTTSTWARPMAYGSTPGLWHPFAAWIKPVLLVRAWLDHPRIRLHGACAVHGLQRQEQQWQLRAEDGATLGQADTVVFANAHGSAALLQRLSEALPPDFPWIADVLPKLQAMQALRGTLSMGPCPVSQERPAQDAQSARPAADFPAFPVNGHGSFVSGVPTAQGPYWFAGSTFRSDAALHADLAQEHAANLGKLQALLPAVADALAPQFAHGQVQAWQGERCVTYDRLPLVGPLDEAEAPSLWLCAGMGARGLSFSALCAELLAAELGAEPLPLESSLARALGTRRRRRARAL